METAVQYLVKKAEGITARAIGDGRQLSKTEVAEVEDLIEKVQRIKDNEAWRAGRLNDVQPDRLARLLQKHADDRELVAQIEGKTAGFNVPIDADSWDEYRRAGGGTTGGGLADSVFNAGFSLKHRPSVTFPAMPALGLKANVFPAVTDWSRSEPFTVPMGFDSRWLYPNLQIKDAGEATSIQDYSQTARTLVGTVERTLTATTNKANVDVTLVLVNEALKQYAVTIDSVPNALFESGDMLRPFLQNEGKFQVQKGLDAAVFAAIVAAGPPFGNVGTGLIAQIRNAVSSMRAEGANPDLVVLNATDAASLDLSTDAGGLIFATRDSGTSSPIWDLKVVERTSAAGTEPPYVIDSKMLGVLYLGPMRFDVDPFSGFKANLATLRVELKALYHVRNAKGARRIAAT